MMFHLAGSVQISSCLRFGRKVGCVSVPPKGGSFGKFRRKFGPGKDGGTLRSPRPVLTMPTNIRWRQVWIFASSAFGNIQKKHVHCILPIKTGSLAAWGLRCECDSRRPTSAMPKPFLCRERAFCCSMLSVSQKTISSSFLSAISIASFIQFFISEHTKISWWCQIQQNPVNRYGPPQKPITFQKHTRQL